MPSPKQPARLFLARHPWLAAVCRFGQPLSLSVLLMAGSPALLGAEVTASKEYQIKAAFLYNFTKFVDWPPARFPTETSPIVIGMLGPNPFEGELAKVVRGRKVNGRAIVIKLVQTADEARAVHVLFVRAGEEKRLAEIWPALLESNVLTVGESKEFAALGGVITFSLEGDKIHFSINLETSGQAGLKISAQLLSLASTVHKKS